ncbi:MAG: hypothetical protein J6T10_25030 [Methanobrevibacter sp.]|nr:hypothetical protein [Methanobrevibacter sp.]
MELTAIIKAVSEVGILLLCGAVVIWQVINDRNNDHKRQKETDEKCDTFIQKIIDQLNNQNSIMLQQILNKVDSGHIITSDEDRDISKVEKELEFYLDEILKETNANRVSVFRYHNGGKDYNGKSFLRMSMTNEVVKGGTAIIQPQCQNLFRSMFFSLIHSLEDNDVDLIKNIEDIKDKDGGLYGYLKDFGIEAKYTVSLHNNYGDIVGFITLDFSNNDDLNIEKLKICLQEKRVKIEALLNL